MGFDSTEYHEQVGRVIIRESFAGFFQWRGRDQIWLSGWFGREFLPLVTWKKGISLKKEKDQELWPVYNREKSVEVRYCLSYYNRTENRIVRQEQIKNPLTAIKLKESRADEVSVAIEARGEGWLSVGELVDRVVENGKNIWYLADSNRELMKGEFRKGTGDSSYPLIVLFSDTTLPLGKEWEKMVCNTRNPVLLLQDERLREGLFFIGSQELENSVVNLIQERADKLSLKMEQIIFTGISAGATAALYYGTQIKPGYMLIGNPLVHLGTVAARERLARAGEVPESLDLLLKQRNGMNDTGVNMLNHRLTGRIKRSDLRGMRIDVAYMIRDNWDPEGWADLLHMLLCGHAIVYGKGFEGRHREKCMQIMEWMEIRFRKMLENIY